MQQFWNQSSASLKNMQKKKDAYELENSHVSIGFSKKEDDLVVDLTRKTEYKEPTFWQNREQLQEGHEYTQTTATGQYTTDSMDKQTSAIRYQESIDTPAKQVYQNMQSLKESVDNQTLFEVLPEDRQTQQRIMAGLKTAKDNLSQSEQTWMPQTVTAVLHEQVQVDVEDTPSETDVQEEK